VNTNVGFVLQKKNTVERLYWKATGDGPSVQRGRYVREKKAAARFTTRQNAELFRQCLNLDAEVVRA